jgi:hypothetical protein
MKLATGAGALLLFALACSQKAPAPSASPIIATRRLPPLAEYRNGLSDADRRQMYHLSEGSEIILRRAGDRRREGNALRRRRVRRA